MAVLNFIYKSKFVWCYSSVIIPSLLSCRQSITASVQMLPDYVVKSVSSSPKTESMCQQNIRLSISLRLSTDVLHVMHIKDQQIPVFHFIFDLLWTGRGSSVSSVAFVIFRELK